MEVYYRPGCPYSENARTLLKEQRVECKEVIVSGIDQLHRTSANKDPKLAALIEARGHKTVPLIVYRHNGTPYYIGGYTELQRLTKNLKRLKSKKTVQDERIASLAELFGA